MRDAATATLAVQAALSGHRLICTLHAASAGGAIARLLEMGLEPYRITSSLTAVCNQRLLRAREGDAYRGRVPVATWTPLSAMLRGAILRGDDASALDAAASGPTLAAAALTLIESGRTDAAEVARVLGDLPG